MKTTLLLMLCLGLAGPALAEPTEIAPAELVQRQAAGEPVLVIDVRTPAEYAAGHVPGAINLPHDSVTGDEPELQGWQDKPVVVYCRSGRRSALAAAVLERQGFSRVEHLEGDIQGWQRQQWPLVKSPPEARAASPE